MRPPDGLAVSLQNLFIFTVSHTGRLRYDGEVMTRKRLNLSLLSLMLIGVLIGCGGDKTPESAPEDGNGTGTSEAQGSENKETTLVEYLPGKRILVNPPEGVLTDDDEQDQQAIFQFENNGSISTGALYRGQVVGFDDPTTYEIKGLTVSLKGEGEAALMVFESENPQKGGRIMVKNNESSVVMTATIFAIEKAGELKAVPQEGSNGLDEQSEPDGFNSVEGR